jgi:AbrB family looped-hinge helix DNA binding protein
VYDLDMSTVRARVTRNGQISLPADVRRRWNTERVLVIDRGSYAIVRPVPDDILASLRGKYAGPGPSVAEMLAQEREEEAEIEERRYGSGL